jgi:hypothetical protein
VHGLNFGQVKCMILISVQLLAKCIEAFVVFLRPCPAWQHGEEVHARKWKVYGAMQDTA